MLQDAMQKADGKQMEVQTKAQTEQARMALDDRKTAMQIEAEDRRHAATLAQQREQFQMELALKYAQHQQTAQDGEREFNHKREVEGLSDGGQKVEAIYQALDSISQAVAYLVEKMNAPKPIVYDQYGKVVSVGDRQVVRGPDGRAEMLN
jgi:hypothetical protein